MYIYFLSITADNVIARIEILYAKNKFARE